MNKTRQKLVTGYIVALVMVLGFFTLASYANTFHNNYYNFGLKFISFFICGMLLRKYFTKEQAILGALLYIGLLLSLLIPFTIYRLYITLPAYSFCCVGFAAGYFFRQLKPLMTVAVVLVCGGWAWVNAAHIYPNFMEARWYEEKKTFKTDAPVTGLFGSVTLQKGDSAVNLPAGGGKVYLIDFFFNNCPPCRAKEPYLQQIAKEISNQNFEVLYVESGKLDSYNTYRRNYERLGGKVLYDTHNTLIDSLKIEGYPFELIIDKKGKVRHINKGFDANTQVGSLYVTNTKGKIQKLLDE